MKTIFGLVCTDCREPYTSDEWREPFLCPSCEHRDAIAQAILRHPVSFVPKTRAS